MKPCIVGVVLHIYQHIAFNILAAANADIPWLLLALDVEGQPRQSRLAW